jgi:hypothetical protein
MAQEYEYSHTYCVYAPIRQYISSKFLVNKLLLENRGIEIKKSGINNYT